MSEQVAVQRIQSWVANVRPQRAPAEIVEDNGVRDAIQSVEGRLVKLGPGARGRLEGGQAHGGLSTSQPRVRNGAVNCGVRSLFMPDPGLDTRQHERPVNKRTQRIRKPNAGSQAEPEAFRPHLRPDSIEPENGPEPIEVKECEGYASMPAQRCRQLKPCWNLGRENVGSPLSTLLEVSPVRDDLCPVSLRLIASRVCLHLLVFLKRYDDTVGRTPPARPPSHCR